jgi:polyisoprenoid-binding protein YceI
MIAHVKGTFKNYDASIYTTGIDFTTAEIDVWIDPASFDSGDAERDEHIIGKDFFDTENHKQISFSANTMEVKNSLGEHELWGDLTMKGITKHIMLKVEFGGMAIDGFGREKAGFIVTGKINRSDWGLEWNSILEGGGLLLSDEIKIFCELELINLGSKDDTLKLENNSKFINA